MPINELFPEEQGYEYSSPMSLVPVRRKVQIPLAPEYWQNELAIPGLPRSLMNEMWLALMSPARAVAGVYTPEEIEQVGLRAGFGIADMGAGMPLTRPTNSLGMFGLWGKKKPPAPSASSAETGSLPSVDKFSNELAAVAEWAKKTTPTKPGLEPPKVWHPTDVLGEFEQKPWKPDPQEEFNSLVDQMSPQEQYQELLLATKQKALDQGVLLDVDANEHGVVFYTKDAKTGRPIYATPDLDRDLIKLQMAHEKVPQKSGTDALADADYPAPSDDGPNPGLEKFNSAYAAAKEYLGDSQSIGISAHPDTGEWSWVSLKTGEPINVSSDHVMAGLMKDVNKAASDYAASFNPKHPDKAAVPVLSAAEWQNELQQLAFAAKAEGLTLEFTNGDLPLHNRTGWVYKDKDGNVVTNDKISDSLWQKTSKVEGLTNSQPPLTSAKKMNHFFGPESAFGKSVALKATDSFYPNEYSSWDLTTSQGLFKILDYKKPYGVTNGKGGKISGGNTAKVMGPNEDIYDFKDMSEAKAFIVDWIGNQQKPFGKNPSFKGDGSKLLGGGDKGSNTLKFKPSSVFTEGLEKMDPEQTIREYSPEELDWEYNTEYGKYAKSLFPDAFKDRADFQRQYDAAPLRHLTDKELKGLEYATISGVMSKGLKGTPEGERYVMDQVGHRRDVPKIMEALKSGRTAPPIVLRHDEGMRILGGNTRMMSAIALGKNIPVKVIDIRSFPRRGSHPFDPTPPTTPAQRQHNFKRWFRGSKVVDEAGEPLVMYHASPSGTITHIDPDKIREKSGGSRDFLSTTSSQRFASDWKKSSEGATVYPVYISAKNPGDFRNPEHVTQAAAWKALDEVRQMSPSLRNATDREVKRAVATDPEKANLYNKAYKDSLAIGRSGIWSFWEDPKMWRELGWDGAFMKESTDAESPLNFAAPNPSQIKSVFNKGWWNEKDDRILYSSGLPVPIVTEPVDYDPFELEPVAGDPFEQKDDKK